MNERIREIAEAADFYVGNEHYDKSREEQSRLLMQRFAELIIRECIDTAFHKGHPDLEFLLKHFGVEE